MTGRNPDKKILIVGPSWVGDMVMAQSLFIALKKNNPEVTIDELMEHIPGPDFPTGGSIMGRSGIHSAYHTGRGSVIMRAKTHIEEVKKDREAIIVTEISYQINKSKL